MAHGSIDARIYQRSHFADRISLTEIANAVKERFNSVTHLLCRGQALAVVWTGVATPKGRNAENLSNMAKVSPIAQFLNGFLNLDDEHLKSGGWIASCQTWDPISLWLPARKYDLDTWLPSGETSGRFIRTGFTKAYRDETKLRYELCWRNGLKSTTTASCVEIIQSWHREATISGFGDEMLGATDLSFSIGKQGVAFTMASYAPVTFPWVELYLRLRTELPRSQWPIAMMYTPL